MRGLQRSSQALQVTTQSCDQHDACGLWRPRIFWVKWTKMVKVAILLERQRKLCWGSAAICSNCMPGIKYIAMHCIYQNQRKLFAFLMFMFLARTEKEEIEYCALTVGKRKDLSHFPNESDYWTRNHCHHQSLSLSSLSSSSYSSLSHGSKQAMELPFEEGKHWAGME